MCFRISRAKSIELLIVPAVSIGAPMIKFVLINFADLAETLIASRHVSVENPLL